ncbi:hypothetical protein EXM22_11070 [Oceanispirochaeta crateris]|uniref:Asp/Glu/hydantoin racemase n=1 Tax=Oceanispirochaeta crateris TaxID=2518645 RepID=A0A5C1QQV2_9SPIO|nr:aspartate/glutamate racemase family protein [Oceanispirochaeta crateris]QEN08502.1 hypothetical protein EXM22_11070 [Oceanispirochaeta crateris]
MKNRIALIHTTPLVLGPVQSALEPYNQDYDFFHMLDEAVLFRMMKDGNTPELTVPWLQALVDRCIKGEAKAIIVSCSSLSPSVVSVQKNSSIPIVRIDEKMFDSVLSHSNNPVVLMTNPTNKTPAALLGEEMRVRLDLNHSVPIKVCPGAFETLMKGDVQGHDTAVVEYIIELLKEHDDILLSQISMARVRDLLPQDLQSSVHVSLDYTGKLLEEITEHIKS